MDRILSWFKFIATLDIKSIVLAVISVVSLYLFYTKNALSDRLATVITERDDLALDNQLLRRAFRENQEMLITYIISLNSNQSALDTEITRLNDLQNSKTSTSTAAKTLNTKTAVPIPIQAAVNILIDHQNGGSNESK